MRRVLNRGNGAICGRKFCKILSLYYPLCSSQAYRIPSARTIKFPSREQLKELTNDLELEVSGTICFVFTGVIGRGVIDEPG